MAAAEAIIIVIIDGGSCWPGGDHKKSTLEIAVKSHETKKPLNQTSKKTTVGDLLPHVGRGSGDPRPVATTWSHQGRPGV